MNDIEKYDIASGRWESIYIDAMARRYLGFAFQIDQS